MSCIAPSAVSWRTTVANASDAQLDNYLRTAWSAHVQRKAPYGRNHHDWSDYRAITLREARKRGLDLTVATLKLRR